MNIYIPSRGRWKNQTTIEALPPELHSRTTLVVPRDEQGNYRSHVPSEVTVKAPPILPGIGPCRHWCCQQEPAKVLMLDDDLVFATRRFDDPTKFKDATHQEIIKLVDSVFYWLNTHAHVGVSTREGGNRDTKDWAFNTRLLRMLAYRTDVLRKENIRFDDIPVMEDFHVTLSLLTKGYPNVKLNHMVHNQNGSGLEGGCSTYRDKDMQARAAHSLHTAFPDFVKVVQKETKGAWGGGTRTDVRIQWKKAHQSAPEVKDV